jgi:hypothetical protein
MSFAAFDYQPMRTVFLAIPCHSQNLDFKTASSLLYAISDANHYKFQIQVVFRAGDSLVHKARNVLLAEFVKSGYTDLFCVDDDISWEPGTFGRMVMHPVDFVAGCYRSKQVEPHYFVRPIDGKFVRDPKTGLIEVETAPAGFLRITRKAVDMMIANCKEDEWFTDHAAPGHDKIWQLFDMSFENNTLWGEDYVFCRNFRRAGGRVWVDPDILLHHTGKATFSGRLIDALQVVGPKAPVEALGVLNDALNGKLAHHCQQLIAAYEEANASRHQSVHPETIPLIAGNGRADGSEHQTA